MKDKGFKILWSLNIIFFLLDLGSTLLSWDLIPYLESNILYSIGGLPIIIIANCIFFVFYWYIYAKFDNNTLRFFVIFILIAVIITRIIVIHGNIGVAQDYHANPEQMIEAAKQVTQQQKNQSMLNYAALNFLPFFNGILAWLFFIIDHKIKRKEY